MSENESEKTTTAGSPRSWHVGYGSLGLISIVAESQEALAKWINNARYRAGLAEARPLIPVQVLRSSGGSEVATIWLDPLLIEAVLDEHIPTPPGGASGAGPQLPPGLQALLDKMTADALGEEPEAEAQVPEEVVAPAVVEVLPAPVAAEATPKKAETDDVGS